MSQQIQYNQTIGFSFRYRASITNKVPGQDPKYYDTKEQTLEIEGAGYVSLGEAITASEVAKAKVIQLLNTLVEPEKQSEPPAPEVKQDG